MVHSRKFAVDEQVFNIRGSPIRQTDLETFAIDTKLARVFNLFNIHVNDVRATGEKEEKNKKKFQTSLTRLAK